MSKKLLDENSNLITYASVLADKKYPIRLDDMEEYILKLRSKTGLSQQKAEIFLKTFFQEIRQILLNGEEVSFYGLGTFSVRCPKANNSKVKVFAKFKASKSLIKKINE